MSILMTLRIKGDGNRVEAVAAEESATLTALSDRAQEFGVEYHRFYASDDELLVVDLWPDQESFERFWSSSPEIPGFMEKVGVTSAPEVTFWRTLATGDEIG